MRAVKNKDSKIEIVFRRVLWSAGYRYRKNPKGYFGKPDIVLKKYKIVIFIDSCFWHGCARHCRLPGTNYRYWHTKITRNKKRDRAVATHYKKTGWRALRVWEHDIMKKPSVVDKMITRIKVKYAIK